MSYQVVIPKPVQKQLDSMPDNIRNVILKLLISMKENPRPHGCVKLKRYKNEYRLRIRGYRIRYEVLDQESKIILLHCKHRKDIYKR